MTEGLCYFDFNSWILDWNGWTQTVIGEEVRECPARLVSGCEGHVASTSLTACQNGVGTSCRLAIPPSSLAQRPVELWWDTDAGGLLFASYRWPLARFWGETWVPLAREYHYFWSPDLHKLISSRRQNWEVSTIRLQGPRFTFFHPFCVSLFWTPHAHFNDVLFLGFSS